MKRINYNDPRVAGYLLLGVIFLIIGFSKGFIFFILGGFFIYYGIKVNEEIT